MSRPLTLRQVQALALSLDHSGIRWMHADRRHIRAFTDGEWTAQRKAQWKLAARRVYPWATISLHGPRRLVSSLPNMAGAGRDLLTDAPR